MKALLLFIYKGVGGGNVRVRVCGCIYIHTLFFIIFLTVVASFPEVVCLLLWIHPLPVGGWAGLLWGRKQPDGNGASLRGGAGLGLFINWFIYLSGCLVIRLPGKPLQFPLLLKTQFSWTGAPDVWIIDLGMNYDTKGKPSPSNEPSSYCVTDRTFWSTIPLFLFPTWPPTTQSSPTPSMQKLLL